MPIASRVSTQSTRLDDLPTAALDALRAQLLQRERRIRARVGGGDRLRPFPASPPPGTEGMSDARSERLVLRLEERDLAQLAAIEAALARIAAGGYGECARCEEPIPPAHLAALPTATTCVECAEKQTRDNERCNGFPDL